VATYSDVIRERFRHPRFRGALPQPDATFEDVNPLCGDRIRIDVHLEDGRVADARFMGDSCAIAGASADMLLELMLGQPAEAVNAVGTNELLERLEAEIRPSRMKCVALPLAVMRGALAKELAR
jgi:nitrogen fixation NifU-like protein